MNSLWNERHIGEVLQLEYGKPLDDRDRKPDGMYPVYGANGEKDRTDKFFFDKPTIIVGRKGSAGELNLTEPKFWPLDVTYFVTFDERQYDLQFLYYLLTTLDLPGLAKGVKPGINRNEVYAKVAKIPPLPEQQRIVGILDEAFERIVTAKANCEKNLQNARALFESHLNAVFTRHDEWWMQATIGEVCDIKHGFAFDGADFSNDVPEGNPLVITPGNFTEDGKLLFNYRNSKRFNGKRPAGFQFDVGDLVVVMTDLSSKMKILGKPAFVETDGVLHNQRIGRVVFVNDRVEKRFLYYFMMTEGFLKNIKGSSTGTMVKHTAPKRILCNVIHFPENRKGQLEIVRKLDDLREETQRLESLYQRKLTALDELKKSLLHQAFSGQLTAKFSSSAVVPFPVKLPNINTTDLHAGILAMAYQHHEQKGNPKHFGHVKAEKIAHMVEAYVGVDLGRQPIKDAAGPNDYPHLKNKVEPRAKKAGYFDFQRTTEAGGYQVTKLRQFDALIEKTRTALGDHLQAVDRLLDLLLPMNTQQAEVMCTVYAGWNNLLLKGQQPSDEEIVYESRENWHTSKLNIPREKFFAAIRWMREKDLIPTGRGKPVLAKQGKQ